MADGRITAWTIDRARVAGLPDAAVGELVAIDGGGRALVTALLEDSVEVAPLSAREPALGAAVERAGPLVVAVPGPGRVVNYLGEPLDGGGPIDGAGVPVFATDRGVHPAAVRGDRLLLGMLALDLRRVFFAGASLLVTGPVRLARHVLAAQAAAGRVCIHARPGATGIDGGAAARTDPACIQVVTEADPAPAQQWLVPWAAMAIAAALRDRGERVAVLLDELAAWQPHVRHFADRGTWPTHLGRLASRAYATPSGSVALIAAAGEHAVPTLVADAFDHAVELTGPARGELAWEGTSLVIPPIALPSRRRLAGILGSGTLATREALRVRPGASPDPLDQLLGLLAVASVPELAVAGVGAFLDAFTAELARTDPDRLARIRRTSVLTTDDEAAIAAIAAAIRPFP